MPKTRAIKRITSSRPTIEGAGVHLKRAFGFGNTTDFDPFLLFDDFRGDKPDQYIKGFPWHPHRGIETITYMLEGYAEHGDSIGNSGVIGPGDVQWMTAGNGIIHQEMPKGDKNGRMGGFQLWANLPASHKMMNPRYRDILRDTIPEVSHESGAKIRIICGKIGDIAGPVTDVVIEPEYLDIAVPAGSKFTYHIPESHNVFAYIIDGSGLFGAMGQKGSNGDLVLFDDGEEVIAATGKEAVRFLLISGKPLREPVAWYGPIVMNTQDELKIAMEEYRDGTFIKHRGD